ncbi:hypothetical protein TWF281_000337 [Arthrobotrys megalospora]
MSTPNRESYTVGWVCAVQTEYVAARCFLDEEHGKPECLHINDNNHYTVGKIGGHNVVIAVLPNGEYGISSATAVVKDMLHSFPNIRIGLMVGTGGGAPSPRHDIRLGDIVVSSPRNGKGGVFQYDFGKTHQDRKFEYTAYLNQPPPILRTALTGLASRYEADGHELENAIDDILKNKPRLRKKYKRPGPGCDRLYRPEVIHPSGVEGCITCGDDPSKLMARGERTEEDDNPAVHYGLIASGNQLMKDAEIRNILATEADVLCFEMEAAGLMNQFPCLVIRGICDYADSHKNKEWQGYAAMAAAAYAKDLLSEIVPAKLEAEGKITEIPGILSSIDRNIAEIRTSVQDTTGDVKHIKNDMRNVAIDSWLSAPDPSTNYNKALGLRHEGTGGWFLESEQFTEWKSSTQQSSFLWLHGIPGCGKTILSSTIIQRLKSDLACQPLLYFYFHFTDMGKQTLENMLRSLVSQLYYASKHEEASLLLKSLYSSCGDGCQQPTCQSLREVFLRMVEQIKDVWLVLDALDECSTRSGSATEGLLSWISEVLNSGQINVHLLATSRPESDIESKVMGLTQIENIIPIQSSRITDDISTYIRARVRDEDSGLKRWRSHPEVQSEIETCLIKKANGMFRWAACQLDALENCLDYRSLRKTLISLPKTLDETYARIIRGIPEENKRSAIILLQFLAYSERPLQIEEAIDAIAVDIEGDEYFNPKYRMPNPNEILCYCSSLVVAVPVRKYFLYGGSWPTVSIDPGHSFHQDVYGDFGSDEYRRLQPKKDGGGMRISTELQLTHFSVKEYLTSNRLDDEIARNFREKVAKGSIATVCLAYFLHLDYKTSAREIIATYPLAEYCARYCMPLAVAAESEDERLRGFIRLLFDSQGYSYKNFYTLHLLNNSDRYNPVLIQGRHELPPPLSYASFEGLLGTVNDLLSCGANVGTKDGIYGNALQAASAGGREEVVDLLLNHGADVNAICGVNNTALQAASAGGYEKIVELLLNHGADVNGMGGVNDTALEAASAGGYEKVVELLLNRGADVNAKSTFTEGALLAASVRGYDKIVKLLLNRGAYANVPEGYSLALCQASAGGHGKVVELLLSHGANINLGIGRYGNPLYEASIGGYEEIVELLLNRGADVNAPVKQGNALCKALENGYEKVAELLVRRGVDVNVPYRKTTALCIASSLGYEKVVELLLSHGAEIYPGLKTNPGHHDNRAWIPRYNNALYAASIGKQKKMVELLLSHGADANAPGIHGNALCGAAARGHQEITELLLSRGADIDAPGEHGGAIYTASVNNRKEMVKFLLSRGAHVDTQGEHYHYALQVASRRGYHGIVELLEGLLP